MVLTQEAGFGSGTEEREPDCTEHVLRAKSPGFSLPLVLERAVWSQRGPCRSDRRAGQCGAGFGSRMAGTKARLSR